MLCGELERLEAEFDDIVTALEEQELKPRERKALQQAYRRMLKRIEDHRRSGHDGGPCFEEESQAA